MSVKKVGIPTAITFDTKGRHLGIANTISVSMKLLGGNQPAVTIPGTVIESRPGFYELPYTMTSEGEYSLIPESTAPGVKLAGIIADVYRSNIDEVRDAIAAMQTDITAIRTSTDTLNVAAVNGLTEVVTANATAIDSLNLLTTTTVATDNVTSIMELLLQIGSNTNLQTILDGHGLLQSSHNDLKAMLAGDEFLTDGVTPNPLNGVGLDNIHADLTLAISNVNTGITEATANINNNIAVLKSDLLNSINSVNAMAGSNNNLLTDSVIGLGALKTAMDQVQSTVVTSQTDLTAIVTITRDVVGTFQGEFDIIKSKLDEILVAVNDNYSIVTLG